MPALEREVLGMFSAQATRLVKSLAAHTLPMRRALAHTLKGSARAVGAFAVGDAAAHLETRSETAAIRRGRLSELDDAIMQARSGDRGHAAPV